MLKDIRNNIHDTIKSTRDHILEKRLERAENRMANFMAMGYAGIFNPFDRKAIKQAREEYKDVIEGCISLMEGTED